MEKQINILIKRIILSLGDIESKLGTRIQAIQQRTQNKLCVMYFVNYYR